jgi:hypothetical protein
MRRPKMVNKIEVLHGKLLLKSCSGVLQKLRERDGEDDVINFHKKAEHDLIELLVSRG